MPGELIRIVDYDARRRLRRRAVRTAWARARAQVTQPAHHHHRRILPVRTRTWAKP
jgi:hypothetical protein